MFSNHFTAPRLWGTLDIVVKVLPRLRLIAPIADYVQEKIKILSSKGSLVVNNFTNSLIYKKISTRWMTVLSVHFEILGFKCIVENVKLAKRKCSSHISIL